MGRVRIALQRLYIFTATCIPELLSLTSKFFGSERNFDHLLKNKPAIHYIIAIVTVVIISDVNQTSETFFPTNFY